LGFYYNAFKASEKQSYYNIANFRPQLGAFLISGTITSIQNLMDKNKIDVIVPEEGP
jgi:hypothetical protein